MVRPELCALIVAAAVVPAHAGEMPRSFGLYLAGSSGSAGARLPMLDSRVDVTVRGAIIETVVTQTFSNRSDRATEATYIFPLPADAAVTAMTIRIGARTIRASIDRRAEAQRRYEAAVTDGVGAALLEQERPDVFTQTIAAIPPKGTVVITLRYDTLARYSGGTWELALPMVVAPRYVPGVATGRPTTGTGRAPDTDRAPDASRITPGGGPKSGGATTVAIRFVDPVTDLASPTHDLAAGSDPRREATFVDAYSDHDAVVRWKATAPAAGWVEQDGNDGYAAVVVEAAASPPATHPKKLLLLLDRAATMRGDADAVAHPFVRALLGALEGSDRIAVAGSDQVAWSSPADALRAIDQRWTRPTAAFDLTRALATARPEGAPIVLVTDGLVADDVAAVAAAKRLGVPVHVIGVGPSPARGLLTQIAAVTGGTVRFAIPGDDVGAAAIATVTDASTAAAPLAVTWGTLAARDVVPGMLPRLGTGQAMVVLARVQRAQAANARARGELFAIETLAPARPIDGATTPHGPLARRWARGKLDELLASSADAATITRHALAYGLVSPYTSLVAIGDEVAVPGGVKHSVAVPVSVPAGMLWQAVKKQTTVSISDDVRGGEKQEVVIGGADKAPAKTGKKADNAKAERREPVAAQPTGGTAPTAPAPARTAEEQSRDGDGDEDADARDDGVGAARRSVAMVDSVTVGEEIEASQTGSARRGMRLTLGVGGGLVRRDDVTRGLAMLEGRVELGRRTLVGVDGSLWAVGGDDLQGRLLLTVARRGLARWFELGAGLGLHLGDGAGPAGAVSLRLHVPPLARATGYLRYDAALLPHLDASRSTQSTFTLGVEYGF